MIRDAVDAAEKAEPEMEAVFAALEPVLKAVMVGIVSAALDIVKERMESATPVQRIELAAIEAVLEVLADAAAATNPKLAVDRSVVRD